MKKSISSLFVATLAAGGIALAADTDPPPPPPASTSPSATPAPASGAAGRFAGAAGQRLPLAGVIKEIEEKGKVTKEEFLDLAKKQAEESFSKLDKNNDGVIDKSEIAEIEGRMKGLREKTEGRGKAGKAGSRQRPGADDKKPATATDEKKPTT